MSCWTEDRVDLLKKLWNDGQSASWIAAELGGVTRNAVLGKVHRLGLSGRIKPKGKPVSRSRRKPRRTIQHRTMKVRSDAPPLELPVEPVPEPSPTPCRAPDGQAEPAWITELRAGECRFPVYEGRRHLFCAGEAAPGMPYCKAHMAVAYQPAPKRRKTETEDEKGARLQKAQIARSRSMQARAFGGAG